MRCNWKTVIFIFVLGVLCPGIILFVTGKCAVRPVKDGGKTKTEIISEAYDTQQINILAADGNVLQMSLHDYLTAVLLCEMPASFEIEALKAQAVVARTYTLRRVERGGKHKEAAICTDASCCQGYKQIDQYLKSGGKSEDVEKIERAVKETASIVLTYGDELIEATYFSCSGGKTEDAKDVWGQDIPYLQSTESPGEEGANHFVDTVVYDSEEFARKLGKTLPGLPTRWVENITYTEGGGVKEIRICGVDYSGVSIRQILSLRSASFTINAVGDSIVITTRGFGHRVGMSQYGADAMALTGKNYEDILHHYYKDVQLIAYTPND